MTVGAPLVGVVLLFILRNTPPLINKSSGQNSLTVLKIKLGVHWLILDLTLRLNLILLTFVRSRQKLMIMLLLRCRPR